MERWEELRRHGRETVTAVPSGGYHRSFSSSLLDAIYQSIDEGGGTGGRRQREWKVDASVSGGKLHHRATVEERKRPTSSVQKLSSYSRRVPADDAMNNRTQRHRQHGGSCWKQQHQQKQRKQGGRLSANSTSSSSDSSYGGFSSSDGAEKPASLSTGSTPRLRPIRTSHPAPEVSRKEINKLPKDSGTRKTDGSIGDRFRASKLYLELKKAKAPASPGARLANFLNTLFATAGSHKKAAKVSASVGTGGDASYCSSASSYSRSRLNRTPSSMGNATPSTCPDFRTSVRLFPVSFVVDNDCRPRGHRWAYAADEKHAENLIRRGCPPTRTELADVGRLTREATREFTGGDKEQRCRIFNRPLQADERDECELAAQPDEDDGAASCSSSDLFELDNLAAIGAAAGDLARETTPQEVNHGTPQRKMAMIS